MGEVDTRGLRHVLGCYATGVAVMTTLTADQCPVGVTVNSFSSVSLDPPLILFSLAKKANVLLHFQQAEYFSVNILSHRQEALSNMFARPSTASFENVEYSHREAGCALFSGCVAQLECRRESEIDGGDHRILIGTVIGFHLQTPLAPLVSYRGRYGTCVRDAWSSTPPPNSSLAELTTNDLMVPGWG